MELLGNRLASEAMEEIMQAQQLPAHDAKYESLRITEWWQVEEVFSTCAKFEPDSRPVISEVMKMVNVENPEASLTIQPLSVSQNSALENADATIAQQLELSELRAEFDEQKITASNGSNACTFFAVAICDAFLQCQTSDSEQQQEFWTKLTGLAEGVIQKLPSKIDCLRNFAETYELSEAKAIL